MGIEVKDLSFSYSGVDLFRGFSLSLQGTGICALLGPSGCGKTTLLKLIAGLLTPQEGSVAVSGPVSYVFQESRLFPWLSILENVNLPLLHLYTKKEAGERASYFLDLVGLSDKRTAKPGSLSGGQQQRVSLARAFAFPSSILLMDEPFQSLDVPLRIQLMDMVQDLLTKEPRLVLAVTHDPREAIYLADRAIILHGTPVRMVWNEPINLSRKDRQYSSPAHADLEAHLFAVLSDPLTANP
ncbi:ABC transporter ATP-binding protein [Gracilinema caldarium]|uniref:ABC transporter ATP-binding protein n=1 Tax=Gracilinema caldarium TaxID=215591 RepID=UPI0026EDCC4C|nr:ABC transporter ATP-binding protein [Gracilinema caldarium]